MAISLAFSDVLRLIKAMVIFNLRILHLFPRVRSACPWAAVFATLLLAFWVNEPQAQATSAVGRYQAPPAKRYPLIGVLPARLEGMRPQDAWIALSLYESLTTTVWRMGDVNPLRRDPMGLVIARMCPQFDDACIAALSPAQHGQLALQTYADGSFSPTVSQQGAGNQNIQLQIDYLDKDGKPLASVQGPWLPGDVTASQNLFFRLVARLRNESRLPRRAPSEATADRAVDFVAEASKLYSEVIRLEWKLKANLRATPQQREDIARQSLRLLEKAVQIDGDYYGVLNALGWAYLDVQQTDDAEKAFQRALHQMPGHVAPTAGVAAVAHARKDVVKAVQILDDALRKTPGLPVIGELLDAYLQDEKFFTKADRETFGRSFTAYLAAQRPQAVVDHELSLAFSEYRADRNREAETLARRVISAFQQVYLPQELVDRVQWGHANYILGRVLFDLDEDSRAVEYLDVAAQVYGRFYRVDPQTIQDHYATVLRSLGEAYEFLKRFDEAEQAHQRAVEIRARHAGLDHAQTLQNKRALARLLTKKKDYAGAEALLRPIIEKIQTSKDISEEDSLRSYATLTSALENQKKHAENIPYLLTRLALAKKSTQSEYWSALRDLGDSQWALKDNPGFQKTYSELLQARVKAEAPTSKASPGPNVGLYAFLAERIMVAHLRQREFDPASTLAKQAVAWRRQALAGSSDETQVVDLEARLASGLGFVGHEQRIQGRRLDALPLLQEALALRRKDAQRQPEALADALSSLSKVLFELDRNREALPLSEEAIAIRTHLYGADDRRTLDSREERADVLEDSDKLNEAETEFFEILRMRERTAGKNNVDYLISLNNAINALRRRGDLQGALKHAQEGLQISRSLEGAESRRVQMFSASLANILEQLGRYGEALILRREVLNFVTNAQGETSLQTANAQRGMANLLMQMGQPGPALDLLKKALASKLAILNDDAAEIASICLDVGTAHLNLGQDSEALAAYERGRTIYVRNYGEDGLKNATALNAIANLAFTKGRFEQSARIQEQVLKIETGKIDAMSSSYAVTLNNLATSYMRSGRERQGLPMLMQAITIVEAQGNLSSAATYLANLSSILARQEKTAPAILFGKQAINHWQKVRSHSTSADKELQRSLLDSNASLYRYVADLLAKSGRLAEAQDVLAMLKEEEYFSFIRRDSQEKPTGTLARLTPAEAPWMNRYQELGGSLTRIARELGELREAGQGTSPKAKHLEADLNIANEGFERITDELLKAVADQKARQMTSKTIEAQSGLQETLGQLQGGAVLAQYVVLPDRVAIFVTTPQVQVAREAIVSTSELNKMVSDFRQALGDPKLDPRPLGQALYRLLIEPIKEDIAGAKVETMMLAPDGTLRYLPFAALHDGQRYLIEKINLALYNPAASDKLKDAPNANTRVLGMGLTKEKPGFSALAGVQRELEGIVGQAGVPGEVHFDEAFTDLTLQAGLTKKFSVLHIASHFKFAAGTEADSFLLLGDGNKLSLQEVRRRYRFNGVDLLTLSACETAFGGGEDANGREVEGFATLAQSRGAKAVLASLWPVADESTSRLMQMLYANRSKAQLTKAAALRQAQLSLLVGSASSSVAVLAPEVWRGARSVDAPGGAVTSFKRDASKPFAHPYYWAPFILMGNWL